MMEIGESCKLCLKYVQGTNMAVLDETILGKLEFLQMDLDQSVEDSNSVCKECEERIEKAFDFKSCLVNTESCLVPYVCEDKTQKVNLKVVIEKDNSSMSIGETSTEKEVCRLCKNFVDAIAVISLPKILKDDNVTEVFQGHIPEMDLEVTENPVVCEKCQKSLASFSTLVASWSIANGMNEMEGDEDEDVKGEFEPNFEMVKVKNETIDDFSDSNTTSSTSMLEISDSAKTVKKTKKGKSATVKTEPDSSDIVSALNREIKTENGEEDESMEDDLQLKSEEVEIKDEDGLSTKECGYRNEIAFAGVNDTSHRTFTNVGIVNSSGWRQGSNDEYLKQYAFIQNNLRTFKCNECSYVAKYKYHLNAHALTHKSITEVSVHKCPECNYVTKFKSRLKRHSLRHKSLDDVTVFICAECSYVTKHKNNLKDHMLIHKKMTEIEMFTCTECTFVSKYRSCLYKHILRHNSSEGKVFKCSKCSYETRDISNLQKHVLAHKTLKDVRLYRSVDCSFVYKDTLKKRSSMQTDGKETERFQCTECPFATTLKKSLRRHILEHNSSNEAKTFQCTECPYETKQKSNLQRHQLIHKSLDEVTTFKCVYCPHITKDKSALKRHLLVHKSFSEVKTFNCTFCTYTTKYSSCLKRHYSRHDLGVKINTEEIGTYPEEVQIS